MRRGARGRRRRCFRMSRNAIKSVQMNVSNRLRLLPSRMNGVPREIVKRQLVHFYKADPEYGIGVATRMKLTVSDLPSAVAAE
jgi:catalase